MATISIYNKFKEYIADGSIDLDTDTFKIILLDSSHTFTATNTQLTDVSANEIANGNGYTTGGATLSSVTWTESSGTVTFDAADVTWTASGGSITATDAVIYDDTSTGDLLVASIDFGGSQTAGDGTDFKITWNASGIFTLS